jgi:outer membrane protein TolC
VSLNIPIFSSLQRNARSAQARIALDQAETQFVQAKEQIRLQINKAKNDYQFAIENYRAAKQNLKLAERIENKNQIKFLEGLSSSFDLSDAQQQLYRAQQEYLQAMLEVITNKTELENLLDTTKYSKEN